ncbi:MAG: TonB-dependent siderophore receptor, partial [Acidobacteriota bacterium]
MHRTASSLIHRAWTACLLALLLLTAPLLAQTDNDDDSDRAETPAIDDEVTIEGSVPYVPEETTTGTVFSTPVRLQPLAVSALSNRLIEQQNATTVSDVLENIPGATGHRQGGTSDLFYLRGFESTSSGLLMLDGAREPEATLYPMYNLKRVEVVRGPAGFLYGGSALSGAVNLIRKRPIADPVTRIGLFGGDDGQAKATFDLNRGRDDGRGGFRLNGLFHEGDGYRDGREFERWGVNPTFTAPLGERTELTISADLYHHEANSDAGLPIRLTDGAVPDVPRTRNYSSPFDRTDQESTRVHVELDHRINDRLTLHNRLFYSNLDWEARGTLLLGAFPNGFGGFAVGRLLSALDDEQEFVGNRLELRGLFGDSSGGGVRHDLVVGIELERQQDEFDLQFGLLPALDLDNPVETATEPIFFIPGIGFAGDTTADIIAPYVLDTIHFGDTWHVSLGVRFDRVSWDEGTSGFSRTDEEVSPFAGLVWTPTETFSLFANYGESFSPPSSTVIAQDRQPEIGEQFEVGVKGALLDGALRAQLSVYELTKDNLPITDATGFIAQQGDQRSRGVELELVGGRASSLFNWLFTYAYTDAELTRFADQGIDLSGNTAAWIPEHAARLWLSRRFDDVLRGTLTAAGGVRYVGERFADEANRSSPT